VSAEDRLERAHWEKEALEAQSLALVIGAAIRDMAVAGIKSPALQAERDRIERLADRYREEADLVGSDVAEGEAHA